MTIGRLVKSKLVGPKLRLQRNLIVTEVVQGAVGEGRMSENYEALLVIYIVF